MEEKHHAENDHEIHEEESLVKGYRSYDVVGVHLVVKSSSAPHNASRPKEVDNEVATSVDQGPYVDVARCVEALVIVENSLSMATNEEHGYYRQGDTEKSVNWRTDVSAILDSLTQVHLLSVSLVLLHCDGMGNPVNDHVESHCHKSDLEVVGHVLIRCFQSSELPKA